MKAPRADAAWLLATAVAAGVVGVGIGMGGGGGPGTEGGGRPLDPLTRGLTGAGGAVRAIDFCRDVRPILARNCFKCHGPDPEARQADLRLDTREGAIAEREGGGAAVVPGDPGASAMIDRVTSGDLEERMPPQEVSEGGLKREDIETLKAWIAAGAPWGEHWSFQKPERKNRPRVSDERWCRESLDWWVLARLDDEGLKPSPEAARETLVRRVSLDLTGLPPTPAQVDEFLADRSPDAYAKVVDRLLASPHFGEKWARWWLDLARYADTKGYEKDERRTMWPYRDWVIRAFNADMPFDEFTREQLAGDMLRGATQDQLIATAFHRNTMTNDEGGTDDEEFRTAAVIDRVNTTMEVWQGMTIACAQCHTHKYDPILQTDYYRMFAVFNNTEDADRAPETPYLSILSPGEQEELAALASRIGEADGRITEAVRAGEAAAGEAGRPAAPSPGAADYSWIDDCLPAGSVPHVESLGAVWPWRERAERSASKGERSFGGSSKGVAQQFVTDAAPGLRATTEDGLYAQVFIDPADPPHAIMMQWYTADHGWAYRAYWGKSFGAYGGEEGKPTRLRMGDLPEAGTWVRIEVPAAALGMESEEITGWAFSQDGGTVYWDDAGLRSDHAQSFEHCFSQTSWVLGMRARNGAGLPDAVRAPIMKDPEGWTDGEKAAVREYYLRRAHRPTMESLVGLEGERAALVAKREAIHARAIQLPVMRELQGASRRETHRFVRGSFLNPAEKVEPGVPEALQRVAAGPVRGREELSGWLFSPDNPLTARVIVNRLWEQLWGVGIVETVEDFGLQGSGPSDQDLLDQLAVDFRLGGWSTKKLLREIVLSAAYRQSSVAETELRSRDPYNRLLARGPRFRLDGELLRDQALSASGLLSDKLFGPPVFPPQPDGTWIMIYNDDQWITSTPPEKHRRAIYTFWRRTIPYPSMTTFDAPSREFCVSRRIRTNTPLQAFVTLNDPAFVECAQAMARRVLREAGVEEASRLSYAFRLATARRPDEREIRELASLLEDERRRFGADRAAAEKAATVPLGAAAESADIVELAAWTQVCSVILNLDETLTKE